MAFWTNPLPLEDPCIQLLSSALRGSEGQFWSVVSSLWPLLLWSSCHSSLHAKYAVCSPVTLIASLFSELATGSLVVSSFFSHLCYLRDLHKYPKALCCWICYIRDSDLWILKAILIPETWQSRVRALAVRPFPAASLMSRCPLLHVCESDEYKSIDVLTGFCNVSVNRLFATFGLWKCVCPSFISLCFKEQKPRNLKTGASYWLLLLTFSSFSSFWSASSAF